MAVHRAPFRFFCAFCLENGFNAQPRLRGLPMKPLDSLFILHPLQAQIARTGRRMNLLPGGFLSLGPARFFLQAAPLL